MSDILPNGLCRSACFQLNAMMLLQEGYGLENKRLGQLQVQGLDFVQESPLHAVRSILHHALGRLRCATVTRHANSACPLYNMHALINPRVNVSLKIA